MIQTKRRLSEHVSGAVNRLHWTIVAIVTFGLAVFITVATVMAQTWSDRQVLSALSPYLTTLVESQDRPEMLRVLGSVAESRGGELSLVQNGIVLATTRGVSELDQPFSVTPEKSYRLPGGGRLVGGKIRYQHGIGNPASRSAALYLYSPIGPILYRAAMASFVCFLLGLIGASISERKIRRSIETAMAPLDLLRREIEHLSHIQGRLSRSELQTVLQIEELETLFTAISDARTDLANATERLAEVRAKTLSATSFKQLIHDLHNPVAALREWATILADPTADAEARSKASESVPRLAAQVLRQISAARKNLETEPSLLRESDLRACLSASIQQMQPTLGRQTGKSLDLRLPDHPVMAAHDPDLLQRALTNLLENGIEASRSQTLLSLEISGIHAVIRVSDDGAGLNQAKLSEYLLGQGLSRRANRDALGLASANHIVHTHGGKLVYRPSDLGGAAFEIRLEAQV